jgi:hypothetical protein
MQALAASCEELHARTGNPPLELYKNVCEGDYENPAWLGLVTWHHVLKDSELSFALFVYI